MTQGPSMSGTEYHGDATQPQTTVTPDPTTDHIRAAVANLSARVRRVHGIHFRAADGSSLSVDGSGGLFYSMYCRADGAMFGCHDPSQLDDEVTVMCGGVWTDIPRRHVFDESTMLQVITSFLDGRLDTSMGWEQF